MTFPLPDDLRGAAVEVRPGRTLSVAISGEADAEAAILFVHGAGGSKAQWRAVWPAFNRPGLRRVAWDFPGHGASGDPREPSAYAGEAMVEDWLALHALHRRARTVVVAHSYGVRVTLAALSRLEAQGRLGEVDGLVLLGPPPPEVSLAGGPLATWPLPLLVLMRPWLSRGFARAAWSPAADPALVRAEQTATRRNRLSMMRALMGGAVQIPPDALARLVVPTAILAGADDALTPPAGARRLGDALPMAQVEVLAACGHQLMLEAPNAVIAAVKPYLTAP